jgi:alpha-D-ribose 1-methylphosphonate 5-triphosphate synthase subunit PhnH
MSVLPIMNGLFRHQRNFRILLQAMSRPGRLRRLETLELSWPAMAVAECLLDHEVSFCVVGGERQAERQSEIARATGSRAAGVDAADYVFVSDWIEPEVLRAAKRGLPESPEAAATLVWSVQAPPVEPTARLRVRLTGPGIAGPDGIAPEMAGVPLKMLRALAAVNADYPLGVDSIFLRPSGEVMCLPRSTRIEVR